MQEEEVSGYEEFLPELVVDLGEGFAELITTASIGTGVAIAIAALLFKLSGQAFWNWISVARTASKNA